jgi:hypothetical protein
MRRTAPLVGAMLAALVAVSAVAWAVTTVYCSNPKNVEGGTCHGTVGDDYIIGTDKREEIAANTGDDVVRGGRGTDEINTDYADSSIDYGNDVIYGGPGTIASGALGRPIGTTVGVETTAWGTTTAGTPTCSAAGMATTGSGTTRAWTRSPPTARSCTHIGPEQGEVLHPIGT